MLDTYLCMSYIVGFCAIYVKTCYCYQACVLTILPHWGASIQLAIATPALHQYIYDSNRINSQPLARHAIMTKSHFGELRGVTILT